jgi:hypothetical protein
LGVFCVWNFCWDLDRCSRIIFLYEIKIPQKSWFKECAEARIFLSALQQKWTQIGSIKKDLIKIKKVTDMQKQETILFSNEIGSVTNDKIILKYKRHEEAIPIHEINFLGYHHERGNVLAIGSFTTAILIVGALSLLNISNNTAIGMGIIIFLILLLAIYNWIGYHQIIIHSGEKTVKPIKLDFFKTREGRNFANAIKHIVIESNSKISLGNKLFVS